MLGVAFPHAELNPANAGELELQFLRLAYAVDRLSRSRDDACGYFVVLRQELRDRLLRLKADYGVDDRVRIVFAGLLISEMTALAEAVQAARNAGDADSAAGAGRSISRSALRREIEASEPGVTEVAPPATMPFGIAWDYCGIVVPPAHGPEGAAAAGGVRGAGGCNG